MRGELHARMMHSSSRGWKENERAREREIKRERDGEGRKTEARRTNTVDASFNGLTAG